jgi:hypothetical protein
MEIVARITAPPFGHRAENDPLNTALPEPHNKSIYGKKKLRPIKTTMRKRVREEE